MIAVSLWLAHSNLSSKLTLDEQSGSPQSQVAVSAVSSTRPAPPKAPTEISRLQQYAAELGVSPAPLFKWGLGFVLLPMLVALLSYYSWARRRDRQRWEAFFRREYNLHQRLEEHLRLQHYQAFEWLREIRFQQSYTTGWSGAFKFPIGAESNLNRATTLAQRQLTLPEITGGFVHFLRGIASNHIVVIGIDEMDKLASDDKAHRFLNDLKSVFGVENVFYLISVSESAMSSFERRGLPFRDAFDSAFDNIVYVDYLDFKAARELIARRVVGMPLQFVALCYTIAGGLPRDLLRACRVLMDVKRTSESCELSDLTFLLIRTEMASKWRAALVATERIPLERARNSILETLYQLNLESDASSWIEAAVRINDTAAELTPDEKEAEHLAKLKVLCAEFGTYLYFCATLRQFFVNSLIHSTFDGAWKTGQIDQLARARQAFTVNTAITKALIDEFRRQRGMNLPSFSKIKDKNNRVELILPPSI
jgi:hypothetical protein